MNEAKRCTAFEGHRRLASGPLHEVALAAKNATENGVTGPVFIYDDATGRVIDVDPRGAQDAGIAGELRGRGRPKLGVVAREVTLLPRHWDWLNTQPGVASVSLRRLVEEARRTRGDADRRRPAPEA